MKKILSFILGSIVALNLSISVANSAAKDISKVLKNLLSLNEMHISKKEKKSQIQILLHTKMHLAIRKQGNNQ